MFFWILKKSFPFENYNAFQPYITNVVCWYSARKYIHCVNRSPLGDVTKICQILVHTGIYGVLHGKLYFLSRLQQVFTTNLMHTSWHNLLLKNWKSQSLNWYYAVYCKKFQISVTWRSNKFPNFWFTSILTPVKSIYCKNAIGREIWGDSKNK